MDFKRLAVSALYLITLCAPLRADDPMPTSGDAGGDTPASFSAPAEEPINTAEEAGIATVGRVFGVAGDAGGIDYYVVEMHRHTPVNTMVRSALVPGWGQAFNNEKVKGVVLGLSFFVSAYGALYYYRESQDTYDEYKARGQSSSDLYDDYESEVTTASILGGLAVVLWAYSIFDARRNVYKHLYAQKDAPVEVAFSDGETRLSLKKRF